MQDLQDIYRLQAFVAVVEEGSLSAAVSRLHITQPALSSRLKLLEEGLGCVLLERTGRGVRPTPMGKLVYNIATDILKRMEHLHLTVKHHMDLREGWVHLGGGATAVAGVFPEAIHTFQKDYPNIQFTLHEHDSLSVIEAVRDGAVDIGVVTRNPLGNRKNQKEDPLQGLKLHCTLKDRLEVISAPGHPLQVMGEKLEKKGMSLLPIHLNKQPMILFDKGSAIRNIIDLEFRDLYIQPKVVMTLRSAHSMVRMVERNIGLSIVSMLAMQTLPSVRLLKIQGLEMNRELLVVSSAERTLAPASQAFLNSLIKGWLKTPSIQGRMEKQ